MDNLGKRLIILSRDEIEALYGRPRFTQEERGEYFSLTPAEKGALEQLRFINAKIYFILQLGYFKARNMFFTFNLQEVRDEAGLDILQQPIETHVRIRQKAAHEAGLASGGTRSALDAFRERT